MRKLFAMVATMAIVLSMFSGIAFAATEKITPEFTDVAARRIDVDYIETTEAFEYSYVGGVEDDLLTIEHDGRVIAYAWVDEDGEADVTIPVGTLLKTTDPDATAAGYPILDVTVDDFSETLYVRPVIGQLNKAPGFTWPLLAKGETYKYEGVYSGGGYVALYQLASDGTYKLVTGSVTDASAKVFKITVAKSSFVPGPVYLAATDADGDPAGTVLAKGEIKAAELDPYRFKVDRADFVEDVLNQPVKFTVDVSDLALMGTDSYNRISVTFKDADNNEVGSASETFGAATDYSAVAVNGTVSPTARGIITATINVQVKKDGMDFATAYTNKVEFDVKRAGTVTVSGLPSKSQLQFGVAKDITPVVTYRNTDYTDTELVLNGAGFVNTRLEDVAGTISIPAPKEFGTVEAVLTAFDGAGNAVYTATYTWTVVGLKVEISESVLAKGEAADLVVTVTDQDGKAINNATVELTNGDYVRTIQPGDKNISNGEYTFTFKSGELFINTAGLMNVNVQGAGYTRDLNVLILGDEVYDVIMDGAFLRGVAHKPAVSVKEDGSTASGVTYYLETPSGDISKVTLSSGKLSIAATEDAGEYALYAISSSSGKYGVAQFEVVDPILEMVDQKITDQVKSIVSFKLLDPTNDNEALDWDIELDVNYFTTVSAKQNNASLAVDPDGKMDIIPDTHGVYTVEILVDADFDAADKVDQVPHAVINLGSVDLDTVVEIAEAEFTVTPENPVGDATTPVTFSLVDANGNGLAGYDIYRGSNKIGTTNEDGKLNYSSRFIDHVTFTVELDVTGAELDVTVTPTSDMDAPVVSAPETVETETAVITITDNVRIVRVMINGVEDTAFFPGTTYTKTVNLAVGANTFTVQAMDNNYNTVSETVTITRTVPVSDKVVFQGETVLRQGDYLYVQVRQFEDLGATFGWDDATKTATFVLDGKTVVVTVGSPTAVVDGKNATMPVAPVNIGGRVYVPTRFVAEALGMGVHWQAGDIVTITK